MTEYNSTLFCSLLEQATAEANAMKKSYETLTDTTLNNFVDINKFIKVLYTLFDINGLLLQYEDEETKDSTQNINQMHYPNKFLFTGQFQEDKTNGRDVITYDIIRRKPAALGAGKPYEGNTTHYRPMLRGTAHNKITGCHEMHMSTIMDQTIRFTCWSQKSSQAYYMARFLENFITKYYWFLRRFVPVVVFEGQNIDGRATDKYGNLRYIPVYLDFFIRTEELFILSENEVKNIELNVNKIKQILSSEDN